MKLPLKSVAWFTRQMSTYQDSFVDIRRALQSLAKNARSPRMAASIKRVRQRIIEGDTLFEAFVSEGDRYPDIFLRMTKVGEETGTLAQVYRELAGYLEERHAMRRRFLARLWYPAFMLAVLILALSVITAVRQSVLDHEALHMPTVERVFMRTLVGYLLIVGAIVGGFLVVRYLVWGRTITDAILFFVPGLRGPFRKGMLARFSFSLGLMTGSAIPLGEAVAESGRASGNAYAAWVLKRASGRLYQGEQLTPVLEETRLFDEDFINVVAVGEESGKLSESMQRVAAHYSEEADMSMQQLVTGIAWAIYIGMMLIMAYNIIVLYSGYISMLTGMAG